MNKYIALKTIETITEGDKFKVKEIIPKCCLDGNIKNGICLCTLLHKSVCLGSIDEWYCVRGLIDEGFLKKI